MKILHKFKNDEKYGETAENTFLFDPNKIKNGILAKC